MGRRLYRDITVRGVTYATAQDAADALGVTEGQVRAALRLGRLEALGTGAMPREVTIRGVTYASFSDAARALGVSANTVRAAYRKGTLHRVGTGRVGPEPMRVRIAGREFADVHAAAAHFGCRPHTVWSAICDGDPDRIARSPRYNPARARSFEIGGLRFASMAEASRQLGFRSPEYISKALKRGSKRGRQRILAAAMAAKAQADGQGTGVIIAGRHWSSDRAAAEALGISPQYLASQMKTPEGRARLERRIHRLGVAA